MNTTTIRLSGGHKPLRFFDSVRPEIGAENEAKWCKLFPVGVTKHRGDFPKDGISFTAAFLDAMVANWVKAGRPAQHVNYDHREGVAAGWIEDLARKDDGLYASIRWTPKARGHIQSDEYRFLSPEFSVDGLDKATGKGQGPTLHGCALLNDPYLEELPRVAAANNPHAARAAGANKMDRTKLIALLKLAADATDEAIEEALSAQQTKLAEMETESAKLKADAKTVSLSANEQVVKMSTDLKAASDKVVELTAAVSKLEADKKANEVETYLTDLVKAKKLTPAMRDGMKKLAMADFEGFKAAYDKAPAVIPQGELGVTGTKESISAAEAKDKLTVLAREISEKEKVSLSQARDLATTRHPDVARAARGITA